MGEHQAIQHAAGAVNTDYQEIDAALVQSAKDGRNHRSDFDLSGVINGGAFLSGQICEPQLLATGYGYCKQ